jgi:hypothetical protein
MIGCDRPPASIGADSVAPVAGTTLVGDGVEILRKAEALAQSELERMAAAEMIYRMRTYEHTLILLDEGETKESVFLKYYRQFTGYEVLEVERTTSLLRPVRYTIRFDFDLIGTNAFDSKRKSVEPIRQAIQDRYFVKYSSDSLVRTYECDAAGDPTSTYSPVLERPNYYDERIKGVSAYRVLRLKDVTDLSL